MGNGHHKVIIVLWSLACHATIIQNGGSRIWLDCTHGTHEITAGLTDFVNKVARYLYEKTGVTHHIMSPYHPQANGFAEHLNQTTTDRLKTLIEQQTDWVDCLQTVAWIHRSSTHSSTNYKPIRMLIGRKPKMPVECTDIGTDIIKFVDITKEEAEEIAEEMSSENMRKMMTIHQDIFNDAHGNIRRAQKRQKKVL